MSDPQIGSRDQFVKRSAEILECMANANRLLVLTILLDGEIFRWIALHPGRP